jgi:hypothetical protein
VDIHPDINIFDRAGVDISEVGMDHPISAQAAWVREMQRFTVEIQSRWGARLATWLVIGNAGALGLIFNAIVTGTTCDGSQLRIIVWLFAVGLIMAFLGSALNYFVGLYAGTLISRSVRNVNAMEVHVYDIEKLERITGESVPDDDASKVALSEALNAEAELAKKLPGVWFGVGASLVVLMISASAFAFGLLSPVLSGTELISSCT